MIINLQPRVSFARYRKELLSDIRRLRLARAKRALKAVEACIMPPNEWTSNFVASMERRAEGLRAKVKELSYG